MSRELVYVVDKNDNVIEEKYRDETTPSDRIRIVAVWVSNSAGEVIIAQRAKNKKLHPGLWGPSAAGGVTVGETYLESAKKEVFEELGLDVDAHGIKITQVDKHTYGTNSPGDGIRMLAVFEVMIDWPIERFAFQKEEVASIKWISRSDLKKDLEVRPELYLPHASTWKSVFIN